MTKNASAVKKAQISLRNKIRNKNYKSAIKTLVKKTLLEIKSTKSIDYKQVSLYVSQAYSKIDKAVKKRVMSKNSAARKKSLLLNKIKEVKGN